MTEKVACLHDNKMLQALGDEMEFPWLDGVGCRIPGGVVSNFLASLPNSASEGADIFVLVGLQGKLKAVGSRSGPNAWIEKYAAWIASSFLAVKAAAAEVANKLRSIEHS